MPTLSETFRLIALDLKGHGLSSKPEDHLYGFADQADIVSAFIRQKALNDVVLVGHSYGGGVALLTYLKIRDTSPTAIGKLVLVDSASYPQPTPFFVSILRNWFSRNLLRLVPARAQAAYTLHHLFFDESKVSSERIERYAKYFRLRGSRRALTITAQQIVPADQTAIAEAFRTITVPTLVIWGENDPVIPRAFGERLRADMPQSELVVIGDCGHIPQEEQPLQTAHAIETFVVRGAIKR